MLRRVIIIQARMASARLPGKVLQLVGDRTLLDLQIGRLRRCRAVDEIRVATSDQASDQPIVDWARGNGVPWFCGSADDVLARYVAAAQAARAEVVVRITADCPLIDPLVTDRVINELTAHARDCDYASNVLERTFPRGLDVEAFHLDTLLRMDRIAASPAAREHVTLTVRSELPHLFLTRSVRDDEDHSDLRWTVDTPADLELIRRLHAEVDLGDPATDYRRLVRYVRARPELTLINRAVETWDPLWQTAVVSQSGGDAA